MSEVIIPRFPYFSQLDNHNNPYGTCNITSVAMCLRFLGIKGNGNGQLEDQLFRYLEQKQLDYHEASAMQECFRWKRVTARFSPVATFEQIKEHLKKGKPCIIHGYFTASGHIIVLKGFNDAGFVVNDPYGEYYADGYDTNKSGEGLTYSYDMIRRTCGEDGDLWVHFVG